MPRIEYAPKRFSAAHQKIIALANGVIAEYAEAGFRLTLRQLYYQFVARDWIPNNLRSYKRLGGIVNDARLAGEIDWTAIEDRTRMLRGNTNWQDPAAIVRAAADSYHKDLWRAQDQRIEVWIEKDALVGVIEGVCRDLDVDYFSCRGYVSQSEMWGVSVRMLNYERRHGQKTTVLHLGDHDPSGIDMTRDIQDRLALFGARTSVHRIALTMEQIEEYTPPPNPAKMTDSRYNGYIAEHGDESWELDALKPQVLADLIRTHVEELMDREAWDAAYEEQEKERGRLATLADRWPEIAAQFEEDA